ncbi:hypothetical protein DEJ36_03795 [Curtobacterium sp. MCPF17_052]|nr:hypothetical protein [Curtobacterium sp. MCPF17_052]WIB13086.1 hypothetical protein DEJ36_03795 [Curtobacterium sp. MCPF17_052]
MPSANSAADTHATTRPPARSVQLPARTMPGTPAASGAAKLSEYSASPSRSAAITGMIVVIARFWNAETATIATMPTVATRCRRSKRLGRVAVVEVTRSS